MYLLLLKPYLFKKKPNILKRWIEKSYQKNNIFDFILPLLKTNTGIFLNAKIFTLLLSLIRKNTRIISIRKIIYSF